MRTIRVDIPDEEYAELKFSTHFGEISFILRRAVHDFLVKSRATRGGSLNGDKGEEGRGRRGAEKAKADTSRGESGS